MAFLSRLYGAQINKAGLLTAHKGAGTILTFDSSLDFPTPEMLASKSVESGVLKPDEYYYAGATSLMQKFDYKDSSTLNIYVDSSSNIMYRWKHYTFEEWKKTHWDQDEDGNFIEPVEPKREDYDTDELKRILEWTKDDETMYKALSILKNNRLNVFSHNFN